MVNQVSQEHVEALINAITEQRNFAMDRQADLAARSKVLELKIKSLEQKIIEISKQNEVS